MKYSVVIPAFNAQDTIGSCLDALVNQELLPDEVIIVDNNSTDKTAQLIQEFKEKAKNVPIILAKEAKKGPAAARNKGIELAKGDIIAFTDSDCIPRKDWLKNINEVFLHEAPDAVGGVMDVWWGKGIAQKFQAAYYMAEKGSLKRTLLSLKERNFNNEYVVTLNLAIKRNILLELKGFDTTFPYAAGEDTDLWMRALDKGCKIICWDPTIAVCHKRKESVWKVIKQTIQYETAIMRILKMHLKDKAIIYAPFKGFLVKKGFGRPLFIGRHSLEILCFLAIAFINFKLFIILFATAVLFYAYTAGKKFKRLGIKTNLLEDFETAMISLARGLAKIYGRIYGSFKYRLIGI